jgi:hypothetical protein
MILTDFSVDILVRELVSGMQLLQEECAVVLVVLTPQVLGVERDSVSDDALWGPRLTTRDSRYAYNSRSHETVVNPHNRVGISDYKIHYITGIKVLHKPRG